MEGEHWHSVSHAGARWPLALSVPARDAIAMPFAVDSTTVRTVLHLRQRSWSNPNFLFAADQGGPSVCQPLPGDCGHDL